MDLIGAGNAVAEVPENVGEYQVLERLGIGGMGIVYLAQQRSPKREVALKVIRPGVTSSTALKRFQYEAELLGRLSHEGIARVYEAGTAQSEGVLVPCFAMEWVICSRSRTQEAWIATAGSHTTSCRVPELGFRRRNSWPARVAGVPCSTCKARPSESNKQPDTSRARPLP